MNTMIKKYPVRNVETTQTIIKITKIIVQTTIYK